MWRCRRTLLMLMACSLISGFPSPPSLRSPSTLCGSQCLHSCPQSVGMSSLRDSLRQSACSVGAAMSIFLCPATSFGESKSKEVTAGLELRALHVDFHPPSPEFATVVALGGAAAVAVLVRTGNSANQEKWEKVEGDIDDVTPRLHRQVGGRNVTILEADGELHCVDSLCFHSGGPLGMSKMVLVNGKSCLQCPWHFLQVRVEDGKQMLYVAKGDSVNGRVQNEEQRSTSAHQKQRKHSVERRADGLYVKLSTRGKVDSDRWNGADTR